LPLKKEEIDLFEQTFNKPFNLTDIEDFRSDLKALAYSNLEKAISEEKREIIDKLNIMIYPSEDIKTMRNKAASYNRNGRRISNCSVWKNHTYSTKGYNT
jgi:hypothetical protein